MAVQIGKVKLPPKAKIGLEGVCVNLRVRVSERESERVRERFNEL